jgi:hypothetical protein
MRFARMRIGDIEIAEVLGEGVLVSSAADALDVLAGVGCDRVILHAANLSPDFFRLATGVAGEIMQKFVNYRVRLAVVGGVGDTRSEALQALVRESRRGGPVVFADTLEDAIDRLAH